MKSEGLIKIWDLPLRIFHWLLVSAFVVDYLTEDELLGIHVWAGYLMIALLIFRLIWGFFGNEYARFSQFLCSPLASFHYAKDLITGHPKRYLGHNPAGALMIVLLLLSLLATTVTGLAVYGADQAAGPLAMIGSQHEERWEEIHEFFANFSLMLVLIHIAGVVIESIIHKESLVKAMWHGFKMATKK